MQSKTKTQKLTKPYSFIPVSYVHTEKMRACVGIHFAQCTVIEIMPVLLVTWFVFSITL